MKRLAIAFLILASCTSSPTEPLPPLERCNWSTHYCLERPARQPQKEVPF